MVRRKSKKSFEAFKSEPSGLTARTFYSLGSVSQQSKAHTNQILFSHKHKYIVIRLKTLRKQTVFNKSFSFSFSSKTCLYKPLTQTAIAAEYLLGRSALVFLSILNFNLTLFTLPVIMKPLSLLMRKITAWLLIYEHFYMKTCSPLT